MQLLNKYAPLVIVMIILMTGLTAGLVLSRNQQTLQNEASEKRHAAVSLLDTLPPPSDAQRITVTTTTFQGDLEHSGVWTTSASVIAVVEHYLDQLKTNQWQLISPSNLESSSLNDTLKDTAAILLVAEKNTKQAYISVNRTQDLLPLTEIKIDIPSFSEIDSKENEMLLRSIQDLISSRSTSKSSSNSGETIAVLSNTFSEDTSPGINSLLSTKNIDTVIHLGDVTTKLNPNQWAEEMANINPDTALLFAPGNYDVTRSIWHTGCENAGGCVANLVQNAISSGQFELELPENNTLETFLTDPEGIESYSLKNENLHIAFIGLGDFDQTKESISSTYYAPFVQQTFANSQARLKLCAMHETRYELQVGDQPNAHNWDVFEACQQAGAIILTGADGSYSRTKPLSSLVKQLVADPSTRSAILSPEASTVINSGLGGSQRTKQVRCRAADVQTGCNQEWASIFTTNQRSQPGALFIHLLPSELNAAEIDQLQPQLTAVSPSLSPNENMKAHKLSLLGYGYFETVDGQIIDLFALWSAPQIENQVLGIQDTASDVLNSKSDQTVGGAEQNYCQQTLAVITAINQGQRLFKDVSCR